MGTDKPKTVDEYIGRCPAEIQPRLTELRAVIREIAPEATEVISWAMPTFKLNGNLIHFAAHKHHVGIYPGVKAIKHFQTQLLPYHTSKGAIQLPHTEPLPYDLIREIVAFCVAENTAAS